MPLYSFPEDASLAYINLTCIQASGGDALILLVSFWIVTILMKSREWLLLLTPYRIGLFIVPGIIITVVFEAMATGTLNRWVYSDEMPIIPVIGTGLSPFLQWVILPPFVLWLVNRHLRKEANH